MKRKHIYADTYGSVYRFSVRKWKAMLKRVAAGEMVAFSDYGTYVATVAHNITDLDHEQAKQLLEEMSGAGS